MINEMIAHIVSNCPSVKKVEHAFTTKEYPDLDADVPAIYIAPLGGRAEPSELKNRVRQTVERRILFQIACPADQLDAVKLELQNAVLGKHIAGSTYPFEFEKDELLDVKPSLWWWSVVYSAQFIIKQT